MNINTYIDEVMTREGNEKSDGQINENPEFSFKQSIFLIESLLEELK